MAIIAALVFNDVHIPWQCEPAIRLMLEVGKRLRPDIIVINGDLLDCWQISRFVKHPKLYDKASLIAEIDGGKAFLRKIRSAFADSAIHYIFGNHEFRWNVFIATQARELYGLKGMTLSEQLECQELKIQVHDNGTKENYWQFGKFLIGHFAKASKHSGYTAKALLEEKGISGLQGHTHRGGCSFKRMYDRDMVFYENFCLCDRSPEYINRPNWQLGFSIIYKDQGSDAFHVEPHPILEIADNGRLTYKTFYHGSFYMQASHTQKAPISG